MNNYILSIDLGTTNFKFALYNRSLELIALHKQMVVYERNNSFVEFDPNQLFDDCLKGMHVVIQQAGIPSSDIAMISLTGQAESLIVTDSEGNPLHPGISWKDRRSSKEVEIIREFAGKDWYHITGLPQVTTTWPITKLLWLQRNEQEIYEKIGKVFLMKDYFTYRFCGEHVTEYSVFSFSGLLNLPDRRIWREMQDFLGLSDSIIPRVEEPGAVVGTLYEGIAQTLGLSKTTKICIGALDHIAGMVGTGNLHKGKVSVSMGTVNALALNISSFAEDNSEIECHSGYKPGSVVQLLVIESGGVGYQWFHDHFMPKYTFAEIDTAIANALDKPNNIIFLPYICGLNPPEYDPKARGVFYGFDLADGPIDFSRAVLESNGFLLRKSIEHLEEQTQSIVEIHAIGGSASSSMFCQMVADIIGKPVVTFKEPESTTLGSALMGAVSLGFFGNIDQAVMASVQVSARYQPKQSSYYENKYELFIELYKTLFSNESREK